MINQLIITKNIICHKMTVFPLSYSYSTSVSVHTVKVCGGSGHRAPLILYLGTRWGWVGSFRPQLLYRQEKNLLYPLNMSLCGLQNLHWYSGQEKNFLLLLEKQTWVTESIVLIGQDLKVTVNRTVTENCDECGKWKEMVLNRKVWNDLVEKAKTHKCL